MTTRTQTMVRWIAWSKTDCQSHQRREAIDTVIAVGKVAQIEPILAVLQIRREGDVANRVADAKTDEEPEVEVRVLPRQGGEKNALVAVAEMLANTLGYRRVRAFLVIHIHETRAQAAAKLDAKTSSGRVIQGGRV